MLPCPSSPTFTPLRAVKIWVPMVWPFHQVTRRLRKLNMGEAFRVAGRVRSGAFCPIRAEGVQCHGVARSGTGFAAPSARRPAGGSAPDPRRISGKMKGRNGRAATAGPGRTDGPEADIRTERAAFPSPCDCPPRALGLIPVADDCTHGRGERPMTDAPATASTRCRSTREAAPTRPPARGRRRSTRPRPMSFRDAEHAAALFNLQEVGYIYSRLTNPTVAVLQERIATLEGGVGAVCCSSGHAAQIMALFPLMFAGQEHRRLHPALRRHGHPVQPDHQALRLVGEIRRFRRSGRGAGRHRPRTPAPVFGEAIANPGGLHHGCARHRRYRRCGGPCR